MANLSNINNKFLVTTGGNVLIGQTGAVGTSKLQVTGSVTITGGTTSGLNITTSGTQDTININRAANNDNAITKYQTASADKWIVGLRNTGDDNFRFYSYGTSSDVLTINQASGNVGIGTATPGSSLQVAGLLPNIPIGNGVHLGISASGTYGKIQLQHSAGGYIDFSTSGTDYKGRILYNNASNYMSFNTNAVERMRIDTSGNVGIGTTNPLAINGGAATRLHTKAGVLVSEATEVARFEGGLDGDGASAIVRINTSNDRGLYLEGGRTGVVNFGAIGTTDPSGTKNEAIRIDNTGNVGIGTTSPLGKLSVADGDIEITGANAVSRQIRFMEAGVQKFAITNVGSDDSVRFYTAVGGDILNLKDGKVGIGTVSPDNSLTVKGISIGGTSGKVSIYGGGDENNWTAARNEAIRIGRADILGAYYHSIWAASGSGSESSHWLRFYISNANGSAQTMAMQLDGNGNVGIGTVLPGQKLEVAGLVKHQGLDMTAGVQVDQTTSISVSLSGAAGSWHETGIDGTDIGNNGSYVIQVYSNTQGAGASNYSMYWTGTMSWYAFGTNSGNTSEIYLNSAGHYRGMDLELRTISSANSATPPSMRIQFKSNQTLTGHAVVFKFRRLM